jgi:class 3 adenylate cyclase
MSTVVTVNPSGELGASAGGTSRGIVRVALIAAWTAVAALPVIGLVSLLFRAKLDPEWTSPRLHFALFLGVGTGAFILAYAAGQAADRRGDARVLLLSLAFLVTGGFLALHAVGSPGVLLNKELPGFKVAIPTGLLLAAVFACASAFVDLRPDLAARVVRHQDSLRALVFAAMAIWVALTLAEISPLAGSPAEAGGILFRTLAATGATIYAISALRYAVIYRRKITLLPASVTACFILLAEAMLGSALVGERTWHASWWEWHGLIVTAYLIILLAAHHQWRYEPFRHLYLSTTRERSEDVSVLFADLASYTTFAEQSPPAEIAAMLDAYYRLATPVISKGFGGEVEKFMGDAVMATFNSRGDQPDHAMRAARAGLELQHQMALLTGHHTDWPKLRVGVNSGEAVVRELGGRGYLTYAVVGDTVNVASRLEALAPLGAVLIGEGTYSRLPPNVDVEARPGLRIKGKQSLVDAYVLRALPQVNGPRTPRSSSAASDTRGVMHSAA